MDLRHCAELACILEATARKVGNVHPGREFADLKYLDFLKSAVAIGPTIAAAKFRPLGSLIVESIRATQEVVRTNSNLGIVLLLAPLAKGLAAGGDRTAARARVAKALAETTVEDCRLTYEAIQLANPGGMGKVEAQDIAEIPSVTLRAAMELAADRDLVARQYANDFQDVFDLGLPALEGALGAGAGLEESIVVCQLAWMSAFPDSLIGRKHGSEEAVRIQGLAAEVLRCGADRRFCAWESDPELLKLDEILRNPQSRRNPGTAADLTAATLFLWLATSDLSGDSVTFSG
ncbi:MAG TPA: triphosphoribosyl-dephospho-CoA synthase [Planctomycetia bacterium]|nr:triphosphoribosyl-dephospho-CoA synthase [Planctomycetia bacterium]